MSAIRLTISFHSTPLWGVGHILKKMEAEKIAAPQMKKRDMDLFSLAIFLSSSPFLSELPAMAKSLCRVRRIKEDQQTDSTHIEASYIENKWKNSK